MSKIVDITKDDLGEALGCSPEELQSFQDKAVDFLKGLVEKVMSAEKEQISEHVQRVNLRRVDILSAVEDTFNEKERLIICTGSFENQLQELVDIEQKKSVMRELAKELGIKLDSEGNPIMPNFEELTDALNPDNDNAETPESEVKTVGHTDPQNAI